MFTKYDRAAGAFQDPNVFGPFLVLPGVYLLHRLLTGPVSRMPLLAVPLLIIVAGIFWEPTPKTSIALDYQESKPQSGLAGTESKTWFLHWQAYF